MLVPFLDAVGQLGIGPFVLIRSYDAVQGFSLGISFPVRFLSLREPDFVELLQELGLVVIFIKDFHDDPCSGGSGGRAVVCNSNLGFESKEAFRKITRGAIPEVR